MDLLGYRGMWWMRIVVTVGLSIHAFGWFDGLFDFGFGILKIKYVLGGLGLYIVYLIRERG